MDHADPPLAGSLEPLHASLAGTDAGLGEKYTMNAHRSSTEMGWGRGTAPFPRPHPQKQNTAVYTKVWTHLIGADRCPRQNFASLVPFPLILLRIIFLH